MSAATASLPAELIGTTTPAATTYGDVPADLKECVDRLLRTEAHVPVSTYRVQVHKGFDFAAAERILPYLKRLGITDLYSSPVFEARPGSMHGYDVVNHEKLNPELGGQEGFLKLTDSLKQLGLGLLLDIVPNHMGVGNDTPWWQDVLENGQSSEYAEYFDIDWNPLKADLHGKLLLPILGKQYGKDLEEGNIKVVLDGGQFYISYFDHRMRMAPRSIAMLFEGDLESYKQLPEEFRDLLGQINELPPHDTSDPALAEQRRTKLQTLKPRLVDLLQSPEVSQVAKGAINRVNGKPGQSSSFDRLHAILEAQAFRLALWRVSGEEINYRRFFDVNDLVGLRMENPRVFAATHCRIRELLAEHRVTGLRIDHADGMFNPRQYLIRLQLLYIASQCCGPMPKGNLEPSGIESGIRNALKGYDWVASPGPLYTVVEKILEPREYLPREWPVRGTSGYDFVYTANQLFIQRKNEKAYTTFYAKLLSEQLDPDEVVYRSKLLVMQTALSSEVFVLTNLLSRVAANDRSARDFTDSVLEAVIRETIANFPVYRTYIDDRGQYNDRDRAYVRYAIAKSKQRNREIDASAFDFLRDTLLLGGTTGVSNTELGKQQLYFALKFQQLTGPVMAKGVEDTTFYRYVRFVSNNEVGGTVKSFGITLDNFHESNQERLAHSPDTMLGSSTHDTKRAEDVRARLNVLSEIPGEWSRFVQRSIRTNSRFKRTLEDGRVAPDPNEEYLIYQTIVGSWPWEKRGEENRSDYIHRIKQYMAKALSEAKINLSWINPDPAYTGAVNDFITGILSADDRERETRFVTDLEKFVLPVRLHGAVNSLSQTLLKMTAPGVPDFYQGSELWDLSLVDPDNRRAVDYGLRTHMLEELEAKANGGSDKLLAICSELLQDLSDGRVKLWLIHRALAERNRNATLFRSGAYVPLKATGTREDHVVAFLRSAQGTSALVVAPRFTATLTRNQDKLPIGDVWGESDLVIPQNTPLRYKNTLTGELIQADNRRAIPIRNLLAHFPVACLISEPQ